MRHLFTPILAILFTTFFLLPNQVMAQAPYKMSYQAVIRDVSGTLIASSPIGMQISILQGSATGVPVFVETHLPSTNVNGLATIEIGNGTLVSGDFTTIDWSSGPYYIKTETDPTGGSTYSIAGTSELMSVPYALHAKTAENVFSGDYNDLTNQPPIPTNTSDLVNDSGFITSPDDADADPTNELNTTVVLSGTNLEVTDAGGTIVTDLSSLSNSGTDDQTVSLTGTNLSIEDGNTIDLSSIDTDTQLNETQVDAFVANNGYLTSETDDQNIAGSGLAGTTLTIGIEGGTSQTVDLSSLSNSGTDDQTVSLTGTNLSIEDGNTIDLSSINTDTQLNETQVDAFVANNGYLTSETDDQNIAGSGLAGTTLTIGIEGGTSQTVDLSSLSNSGTDDQTVSLTGTNLTIENGNTVDLSPLQDGTGTDDQSIAGSGLAGTTLTIGIEGGTSQTVDLSSLSNSGTDDQTVSLTGTNLSIEDGNTIDLSSINTDTQLNETQVDAFVANNGYLTSETDDQNISGSGLAGTTLTIGIEGGTSQTVDLSSLSNSGTDDQTVSLTGTNLSIEDGNTIDLSSIDTDTQLNETQVDAFVANNGYLTSETDDQNISGSGLAGTTLTIGIEGGTSQTVDLSSLSNSGTDDQTVSLTGTNLTIENGNTIDLSSIDTDTQLNEGQVDAFVANNGYLTAEVDGSTTNELNATVVLNGTNLEVTDAGGTIVTDLSSLSNSGTDDQNLTINNTTGQLSIETGNTVQISTSSDADGDTKIQVEESADEDQIRFDIAGTEKWVMTGSRLEVLNTGNSVFIGEEAGKNDDLSDNYNTFIGHLAGSVNTTGTANTIIGAEAGVNLVTGSNNTFIGEDAGEMSTGSHNVYLGENAAWDNTNGSQNTVVGQNAGGSSTGSYNVLLGRYTGASSTGSNNVFLGYRAGENETGSHKLFIDNTNTSTPLIYGEFDNNLLRVNGSFEVKNGTASAGKFSLYEDGDNGANKVTIQSPALLAADYTLTLPADDGTANQVLQTDGSGALNWATPSGTDDQNLTMNNSNGQLSVEAGNTVQISTASDADGDTKIQVEESADEDIIRFDIGGTERWLMTANRIEPSNSGNTVSIGRNAGLNDDGTDNRNVFVGDWAGNLTTSGYSNVYIGDAAGKETVTGRSNVAIGNRTFQRLQGNNNVGIGSAAGDDISGDYNVCLGSQSLARATVASQNVAVGFYSGYGLNQGEKNVFIGRDAGPSGLTNFSHRLYINNETDDNPLIYGEFDSDKVNINGSFGVGSTDNGGGSRTFSLGNGTVPAASATNGVLLYAEDVASSSELKVRDEAGNITTLSPHNFSLTTKSDNMAWAYYSKNPNVGEEINVDMYKVVQLVESLTGEKLIYRKSLETGEMLEQTMSTNSMVNLINEQAEELVEQSKKITNLEDSLELFRLELENMKRSMATENR